MKVIFTELLPSGERQQLATVDLPCLPERGDHIYPARNGAECAYEVKLRRWFVYPEHPLEPVVIIECQKA